MTTITNILVPKIPTIFEEPITLSTVGYYDQISDHEIRRKRGEIAADSIIIYCTKGEGWLISEDTHYTIQPGMLLFCDKALPHAYGANPDNPWQIYWAHFSGPMAEIFTQKTGLTGLACALKLNDLSIIIPYMEKMLHHADKATDPLNHIMASTALRMALLETIRQINDTSNHTYSPLIHQSIQIMKSHIEGRIDLDQVSRAVGSSKYHFVRNFKNQVGQTPMHYYNMLKIENAKELLITTDRSILEISKTFGYSTPFYFSETFKKFTGFSPRAYRHQHKKHY